MMCWKQEPKNVANNTAIVIPASVLNLSLPQTQSLRSAFIHRDRFFIDKQLFHLLNYCTTVMLSHIFGVVTTWTYLGELFLQRWSEAGLLSVVSI